MRSPFEITKAVDFNDPQIERTYVSFGGRERAIVDPASPMPQFLTGVKGGGRTHLMRHYSFQLQRSRGANALTQIQHDGYLGVYFRCSGLNGSRFTGKGQTSEVWAGAFAYYMDLWLTELLVATVLEIAKNGEWDGAVGQPVLEGVASVLGYQPASNSHDPLGTALDMLSRLRRELDWLINNAAHTGTFNFEVRSNPGDLLFRSCKAVSELPGLADVRITFLADEYENLTQSQQMYFNTLIREKEAPASFLVGGRTWGVKTHLTLSAGEENKKGSEYERYTIEETYARDPKAYEAFCRQLITVRLADFGLDDAGAARWISRLSFAADDRLHTNRLMEVLSRYEPLDRPYFVRLRTVLEESMSDTVAKAAVETLSFPEQPLVEKLATLRFYQLWSSGGTPSRALAESARAWVAPLSTGNESKALITFFKHRKSDAIAQIYRDANRQTAYAGFVELVGMSGYLPRSLLMILKYVSRWAEFHGEDAFGGNAPISERALSEGVLEAANWYLADAKPLGTDGHECEIAVRRLGRYLHSIRYSDKPNEVDVTTFSSNLTQVSAEALAVIDRCVAHGLLIEVRGGRASRNHGSTHRKFQLHPMLTPLWGLRAGRRGDATFTTQTIEAIFNPREDELAFRRARETLELALNAPFRGVLDTRDPLF